MNRVVFKKIGRFWQIEDMLFSTAATQDRIFTNSYCRSVRIWNGNHFSTTDLAPLDSLFAVERSKKMNEDMYLNNKYFSDYVKFNFYERSYWSNINIWKLCSLFDIRKIDEDVICYLTMQRDCSYLEYSSKTIVKCSKIQVNFRVMFNDKQMQWN